ncbi:MAG: hypothetical protein AABW72_05645 [archaeon]
MADFVVKSKVKEYMAGKDMRTAEEALDGLDKVVQGKLDKAIERANANKRKTVFACDF